MRSRYSRTSARRRAAERLPSIHRHLPQAKLHLLWVRLRTSLEHRYHEQRGRRWPTMPLLLALLLLALLVVGWSPRGVASATPVGTRPLAAPPQLASAPRTQARWSDPTSGTSLLLALFGSQIQPPGTATITLPSGDELRVQKAGPLLLLARELSSLPADAAFDSASTVCIQGTLFPAKPATATDSAQPVNMILGVHVGQGGLLAYAGLRFAAAAPILFAATSCVLTSPQYEMKAGCSDLTSPCTPLLLPAQAVSRYNQAVVGAAQSGNWDAVYGLTGQSVTAQYSPSAFVGVMNQQVQRVGRITSVVPASAPSAIQFNTASQAYFVSQDTVTLDHNGTTKSLQITSYYLLEGGDWKFWFSCGASTHC